MELRDILENISAAFVQLDFEWRYVYLNAKAGEILNRKREELIGQVIWEAFPEILGTIMEREIRRAAEERVPVKFSHVSPLVHRWVELQAIPTETGLCLFSQDISKHKQAEEEVRRLNRDLLRRIDELQTLLDVVPVGIAVADDPECQRIRMNASGAAMLGITPSDNASKSHPESDRLPFKIFQNGRELQPDELPMQRAAANNRPIQDIEVEILQNNGRVVNLFEYASPLLDEHGRVRGCLGVFVDVTERKRAEQQF